ncbi:thyroid hormone receptor beta-A-like [Oppia nitens]|uniref:thyroid hormone receptor beta-A-like n=1 Tax=Oppia nitens TaxID=1686743 RepID=UPI0023D9F296|nr:thyroid hormone receptor beta-A-like [Oppia nitens]
MKTKFVDKVCVVCGDKSRGKNFNVISCESCRTFFRRSVIKNQSYKCKCNGKCEITLKTRIICKLCRFNKCLAMGMKQELLQTHEEKESRKQLVKQNQQKIKNNEISNILSIFSTDTKITDNDFQSDLFDNNIIDNISSSNNNVYYNESTTSLKSQNMSSICLQRPIQYSINFNQLEDIHISELMKATEVIVCNSGKFLIDMNSRYLLMTTCNDIYENKMIEIVKFSKQLQRFKHICSEDQLVLVKRACVELFIIRYLRYFDSNNGRVGYYFDKNHTLNIDVDTVFHIPKSNYATLFKLFANKYNKVAMFKLDTIVINLLSAIVLFNPNRPNLCHKLNVKLEQQLYIYLLQRYLQIINKSNDNSNKQFSLLMNIVSELQSLGEIQVKLFIEDYSLYEDYIRPMTKEIYNLK